MVIAIAVLVVVVVAYWYAWGLGKATRECLAPDEPKEEAWAKSQRRKRAR